MAKSAATATSAEEYLSCWRGPLEQRLRKAVGKALAEQPKDPCTAVALALLHGTSLEVRAAALSVAQAEDGPQDDVAGHAQVGCTASKNKEMELRKLSDENQLLKDKMKSLNHKIQSLKDQLNAVSTPSTTTNSRDGKGDAVALESATKWGIAGWVNSLALAEVVAEALKEPPGTTDPFKYVLSLTLADLKEKLEAVKLIEAIAETLWSAIEKLHGQSAATGAALNAKFAAEGDAFKGEMGFGGVEQFYGGLEKLIGPPLMVEGSLFKAMETEHCAEKDADVTFATSNGIEGATSKLEWEFVVAPVVEDHDSRYAERGGDFRTAHREWCRKPEPLSVYQKKMADEMNPRLVEAGQAPLTLEELVAGRMYTGPMYEKYNAVLRFSSARGADGAVLLEYASMEEVPFLQKKCGWLNLGEWAATAAGKGEPSGAVRWKWHNQYSTTIHAINSIIVKLSPLTRITPLYRGWTGATLPQAFFKPDALGFRGGVEYGFSSTTTDRAQAVHYAAGKASTVLELAMGMIDRGADFAWLSQYPHERETLLPPLMGLQVRSTGVEGSTLVIQSSFSINMASLTLEQVAGKRKKLLTDMGAQMAAEVRRGVAEEAAEEASQLVRAHLGLERGADAGAADKRLEAPLGDKAEAYNSDMHFQAAVGDALKVKRAAVLAAAMQHGGGGLASAMDAVLPLQASSVDLTGYDLGSDDGVMVGTVVAWMESEPSALTSLTLDWGKACGRVREAVLDVVRTTRTLVALSVGEKGAMPLNPQQLCGREAVKSLDLSSKGLGPGSAAVVAAGLSVNEVLNILDLSSNNLGGETGYIKASEVEGESKEVGAKVIYQGREMVVSVGVDSDGELQLLKLSDVTGVLAIADALKVNKVLTSLDVGGSNIGNEGAKAIGEALAVNEVLTDLNLSTSHSQSLSQIGDEGGMAIGEAVKMNAVLKELNLRQILRPLFIHEISSQRGAAVDAAQSAKFIEPTQATFAPGRFAAVGLEKALVKAGFDFDARCDLLGVTEKAALEKWSSRGLQDGTDARWLEAVRAETMRLVATQGGEGALSLEALHRAEPSALWLAAPGGEAAAVASEAEALLRELRRNVEYVLDEEAREEKVSGNDVAGSAVLRDAGNSGKRLADFVAMPQAQEAGRLCLTWSEVAALRLYTSSTFRLINGPLRAKFKPHPLAVTAMLVSNALKKIRANNMDDPGFRPTFLWRGMRDMAVEENFLLQGGTELASMSSSASLAVVGAYAASCTPLTLVRIKVDSPMEQGADVSWVSLYPGEAEHLYPPLTFVKPLFVQDIKDVDKGRVVTVKPCFPY